MPAPPILFYPIEANSSATVGPAILESDLQRDGIEYFVIAGFKEGRGKAVLAGMRTVPNTKPCVSFGVTDVVLFANFLLWISFRRQGETLLARHG